MLAAGRDRYCPYEPAPVSAVDGARDAQLVSGRYIISRRSETTILKGVLQVGFQETSQERLERGVVGNRSQCERSAQLFVFAQTNFGFAEGPVLVAHEAQDSQQLRLRELAFAKAGAVGRHDLSHIQSHLREAPQTHFGQ